VLAAPAHGEPLNTLREPYGTCDQQTLDEAVAFESAGDREALRDHVRSYGCGLYFPRQLRPFAPERERNRERGKWER
jgi:hypothetical protein